MDSENYIVHLEFVVYDRKHGQRVETMKVAIQANGEDDANDKAVQMCIDLRAAEYTLEEI